MLELCGTQVRVRRGDGKVFYRNKSCVKLFRSSESDDFVLPSAVHTDVAGSGDVSQPTLQDVVTGQCTRSGRVVKQTEFYADPVKH